MAEMITIEVAYALAHKQKVLQLQVPVGTTYREAARLSGMTDEFPELDIEQAKLGVFGKAIAKPELEAVQAHDRIEIYRPLLVDPKQARLNRAAKAD